MNWYFKDVKARASCHYWCIGRMWITYDGTPNSSTVQHANGSSVDTGYIMNGVDTAFQQQLTWLVPDGGSDDYIIHFQHKSTRGRNITACTNESTGRSMSDMEDSGGVAPTFNGAGEEDPNYLNYTWIRYGDAEGNQYQFQDYTVTVTASLNGIDILTVTACMRQTPGPQLWHYQQSLAVVSWIVTYH